LKGINSIKF